MNKITHTTIAIFLFLFINGCSGYKPVFTSQNFKFEISDYLIKGNEMLGNRIYNNLYNLSQSNAGNENLKKISIEINVKQDKKATVKDSSGKILEYKININTLVVVKEFMTSNEILNNNFDYSASFKVQDQHSETIRLENQYTDNLIDFTFNDLLIKLSENIQ